MNKLTFDKAFFCLKIRTGETIFTEVVDVDDHAMTLYNPMLVVTDINAQDELLSLVPWIPFTVRKFLPIPISMIYFADNLNKTFFEYYGRTVIQYEMNKIKQRVYQKMDSKSDYVVISEGLDEMKKMSEELVAKFGVDGPDFSEFEAILDKHKSNIVMH